VRQFLEYRIFYELLNYLRDILIDFDDGLLKIWSDNRRLVTLMNKLVLTPTDFANDRGFLLQEIVKIRNELQFNIEINHISCNREQHVEFCDDSL